ncbi:MAG: hypothetical protein LBD11_01490 [Candidatus Peribacteria bacterium]|jgi:hypothetical protein|nr:hypothetical protein [Candidatus Peribacteria bacterium]
MKRRVNKKIQEKEQQQVNTVLEGLPNAIKWRFRLAGFVTAVCAFLFVFILSFLTDFFGGQISTPSKYTQVETLKAQDTSFVEEEGIGAESGIVKFGEYTKALFPTAFRNIEKPSEPYRFLYDGKNYPKLAKELPVYKCAGVLMNEETVAKNIGNLKFGNISLKTFPDMTVESIVLQAKDGSPYSLYVDTVEGSIALSNSVLYEFDDSLGDSKPEVKMYAYKDLSKKIEKKLKTFGISLVGYGKLQIETSSEDGLVEILFPSLFNGYPVWNPQIDQQLGVKGFYNPETDQISLFGIDISSYEFANYPTRGQEEILAQLPTGGDYFDGGSLSEYAVGVKLNVPEVVYVAKWVEKEKFFVPALRFTVSGTGIAEVNTVYKELVDF